jgi:HEPN domain-containing protein
MSSRANDWLRQSENDFLWANESLKSGYYPQCCFISQQVAEKAVKALALLREYDRIKSHSITKIIQALNINGEILEAAKILDQYYLTGRYPDALPEGAPMDYFTFEQAKDALEKSQLIVEFVKREFILDQA